MGRGMHVLRAWDGKLCDVKALRGTGARAHRVCDAIAPPCGAKIEESGTDRRKCGAISRTHVNSLVRGCAASKQSQ